MLKKTNNYLKKYHQEHLLTYYNDLSIEEQIDFLHEINKLDLGKMAKIYKQSYEEKTFNINDYSPLPTVTRQELSNTQHAEKLLLNNQYGIVILGGGHGSRLGYSGPKGCLELNINNRLISLYEIYINQLKESYNKYHQYINAYIMTSTTNDTATKEYFEMHNYFDYPKDHIHFFIQEDLPILNLEGKLLLKDKSKVLQGPNGNGSVYESLKKNDLLHDMKKKNIKYLLFIPIDNPLVKIVDLPFLETSLTSGYELVTKTILKDSDTEMDGVFCKYKGKPAVLSKDHMTKEINNIIIDGDYAYRDKNIVYHLMSLKKVIYFSKVNLPYHRAYKKNSYLDLQGNYQVPEKPNTFKFELFIYDAFCHAKDMLLYRVGNDESLAIKTKEDIIKVEEYFKNHPVDFN